MQASTEDSEVRMSNLITAGITRELYNITRGTDTPRNGRCTHNLRKICVFIVSVILVPLIVGLILVAVQKAAMQEYKDDSAGLVVITGK